MTIRGFAIGMTVALAASGCIGTESRFYETQLRVQVTYPAGTPPPGTLYVEVHHAQTTGRLPHPLGLIESFELEPGLPPSFETEVWVPMDDGEGLVIYAWLDLDGDEALCGVDSNGPLEPAGLTVLDAFPSHAIDAALVLDVVCLGPESLYPGQ